MEPVHIGMNENQLERREKLMRIAEQKRENELLQAKMLKSVEAWMNGDKNVVYVH